MNWIQRHRSSRTERSERQTYSILLLVFWPSIVLKLTCQLINDASGPNRLAQCSGFFDQSTTFINILQPWIVDSIQQFSNDGAEFIPVRCSNKTLDLAKSQDAWNTENWSAKWNSGLQSPPRCDLSDLSLNIMTCDSKRRVSGLQHAQAPQTSISLSAPRHCWLWPICPHCGRTWPDRGLHQQLAPRPTPRVPVGTIHALNITQQNCFGTCIGRIDSKIHDSTRPSTDSKSSLKVKDSMKTLGLQTCHTMSHCLHRSTKEVFSLWQTTLVLEGPNVQKIQISVRFSLNVVMHRHASSPRHLVTSSLTMSNGPNDVLQHLGQVRCCRQGLGVNAAQLLLRDRRMRRTPRVPCDDCVTTAWRQWHSPLDPPRLDESVHPPWRVCPSWWWVPQDAANGSTSYQIPQKWSNTYIHRCSDLK